MAEQRFSKQIPMVDHFKSSLLIWALILTFTLTSSSEVSSSQGQGELLDTISSLCVSGPGSKTTTVIVDSFSKCVVKCYMDSACYSLTFNKVNKTCDINIIAVSSAGADVRHDVNCVYVEITGRPAAFHLAFRATKGIGTSVYEAWNNVGHHDDVTNVTSVDYGCLSVDSRLPCTKHFRSWRLDDWTNVNRVKYVFYHKSHQKFRITVRGSSSANAAEAFDTRNIAYVYGNNLDLMVNLTESLASVEGYAPCLRRFYIKHSHNGCANDYGWMFVSDGWGSPASQCCSYEQSTSYPKFHYTLTGDAVNWSNTSSVGEADVFAVYIKYNV